MEDVSRQDLSRFFQQWTREAGVPHYEGEWQYDEETCELTVTVNQTRPDHTVFSVPLEVGIVTRRGAMPRIEVGNIDQRRNTFTFEVDERPAEVHLDPNTWLLMTSSINQN